MLAENKKALSLRKGGRGKIAEKMRNTRNKEKRGKRRGAVKTAGGEWEKTRSSKKRLEESRKTREIGGRSVVFKGKS